jgi:hypothetical protein
VRRSSPTVLETAASPVCAWQEDVRSAAWRVVLPAPGDLLPAVQVGVLLEPIDLAALIGPPEPASSPEGPLAAPPTHHWSPAELRPAPRPPRMPPHRPAAPLPADVGAPAPRWGWSPERWPGSPERLPAPVPSAAPPPPTARLPADAGASAPRWGWSPQRWPSSPERLPAPVPPDAPGAGAARLAALLQRYEAQEAVAASASAAAGSFAPRVLPEGASTRSDRARTSHSRQEPVSPASARGPRVVVPLPARSAMLRSRLDADARVRTALASMEDVVGRRLRCWSQGIDMQPLPDPALSAAGVARPTGPPATRPPSPGYSGAPGGAPREAGFASAGRRRGPTAEVPASRHLAKLIDLIEQAVGDLAAVERRLAELGVREAPQVQWLEDDELAGRLQGILARQARQRGIDLS